MNCVNCVNFCVDMCLLTGDDKRKTESCSRHKKDTTEKVEDYDSEGEII